jgi:phosphoribosylformylglycinamidine cyclo-ligase
MPTYEERGVSPHKTEVKEAIKGVDAGVFPGAFCKALPDIYGGSPEHCFLLHADGAGTKSAIAYIHYRRHGDAGIFRGIAQDSLVMNLDDLICVGALGPFMLSNTIGRNAKLIPGDVLRAVVAGYEETAGKLGSLGIDILSCGGETADIGDLVRTIVVDSVMATRMERKDFIDCSKVKTDQAIVGLASSGRATYEETYNSGIGSNGLTSLRHELLTNRYREEFPETFAPEIREVAYTGKFDIDDPLPGTTITVGEALLSPTRSYSPIVKEILKAHRGSISAILHNTGGGQTKCLGFGNGIRYVKDSLFPTPPIFDFLRKHTDLPGREMYRVFNMGHRMEVYCDPRVSASIIEISEKYGVAARVVGHTEHQERGTSLSIRTPSERIEYP